MGVRGEIFSTRIILPNRTYFFNVKENRMGDVYLNVVESKNRETGGFDRQSVILFADDLQEFLKGFDESLRVLEKAVREKRRSGSGGDGARRDDKREDRADRGDSAKYEDRAPRGDGAKREDRVPRGDRGGKSGRGFNRGSKGSRPDRGRPERGASGSGYGSGRSAGHGAGHSSDRNTDRGSKGNRPDRGRPERGRQGGNRVVVKRK